MLIESKSHLARLMATENISVEHRNVSTASFDVNKRILVIPILNGNLSDDLYDLLIGHEVGHALETPAEGWHRSIIDMKINKSILNVCEDARIEKKIKRRYPGLKPSFARGYRELYEDDFFGIEKLDCDINSLRFIDKINLQTKIGSFLQIAFDDTEEELLSEVENTETWEEVVAVAQKIQNYMKEQKEKDEKECKEGENDQEFSDMKTKSIMGELESDGSDESDNSEDSEKSEESETDSDTQAGNEKEVSDLTGMEEFLNSLTDQSFRQRENELYNSGEPSNTSYVNIPKLDLNKIIVPHAEVLKEIENFFQKNFSYDDYSKKNEFVEKSIQDYKKFQEESKKVVMYLVKEFELKKNAAANARAKVSKSGEINMKMLHSYSLTDDIFLRMTEIPNGKSHGLVMFVDWSGSMANKLHPTIKQLLNLVMFCRKVSIPFEVYAFSAIWEREPFKVQEPKIGDMLIDSFSLMTLFSNTMKNTEFKQMMQYMFVLSKCYLARTSSRLGLSNTPLNETIVASFDLLRNFQEKNKIDHGTAIFLTDGDSTNRQQYFEMSPYTSKMTLAYYNYNKTFMRDPITRSFICSTGKLSNHSEETTMLLKLLKQRIPYKLLGFFIGSNRDIRGCISNYDPKFPTYAEGRVNQQDYMSNTMKNFRKNKSSVIENCGYDEYYMIQDNSIDTEDEDLVITENMKTQSLVKAFSKYTGNKISSRIILNRFITAIS